MLVVVYEHVIEMHMKVISFEPVVDIVILGKSMQWISFSSCEHTLSFIREKKPQQSLKVGPYLYDKRQ